MLTVVTLTVHLRVPVSLVTLVMVLHVLLGNSVPLEKESKQQLMQQTTQNVKHAQLTYGTILR